MKVSLVIFSVAVITELSLAQGETCPQGFKQEGQTCYKFFPNNVTRDQSVGYCSRARGILAEPRTFDDNNNLIKVVNENSGKKIWIGLDDKDVEGTFKWRSDKAALTFLAWEGNEPNNWGTGEDCAHMVVDRKKWNDYSCASETATICEAAKTGGSCPSKYKEYGTRCFRLANEGMNYDDAIKACNDIYGKLPEPKNEAENNALAKACEEANAGGFFWLGMDDRESEGTFKWQSDKSPVGFSQWFLKEPNNQVQAHFEIIGDRVVDSSPDEDCTLARMISIEPNGRSILGWNDWGCHRKLPFVCQANLIKKTN